jgi:hypothetical protein
MTNETANNEAEVDVVVETKVTETKTKKDKNTEVFSRIFYTFLFSIIGWMTLWVFCFVVFIQFGFLLVTGQVNSNLKGFNTEVGLFLYDLIKYLSFQTDKKPFPFRDWPYDKKANNVNNTELNESEGVKAGK